MTKIYVGKPSHSLVRPARPRFYEWKFYTIWNEKLRRNYAEFYRRML